MKRALDVVRKPEEMLKNSEDPRKESALKEQRGKSDRFVLRFEKPKP